MSLITIDESKCKKDGICAAECPTNTIYLKEKGTVPRVSRKAAEFCVDCGHCIAVCPNEAITMEKMLLDDCAPIPPGALPSKEQAKLLLKSRRSIRAFKDEHISREVFEELIDTVRYAPSGHNGQPVNWVIVESREQVKKLGSLVIDCFRNVVQNDPEAASIIDFKSLATAWDMGIDMITRNAPHIIVGHVPREIGNVGPALDCHLAITYLELAAHSMGLGACWLGFLMFAYRYPPVKEFLGIPEGRDIHGAALIGYPKYRFRRIPARIHPEIAWV
ncbi:MAG: nitroreductase family protein [Bacillota bacterium]